MLQEVCFSQLAGANAKKGVEYLSDRDMEARMVSLALSLEPVRVMLRVLFAFSRGSYSNDLAAERQMGAGCAVNMGVP